MASASSSRGGSGAEARVAKGSTGTGWFGVLDALPQGVVVRATQPRSRCRSSTSASCGTSSSPVATARTVDSASSTPKRRSRPLISSCRRSRNASSRGSTFETAREDLGGGREKDAVNALFYAAEAAVVALAMASRREGSTTFKDFDRALEDILAEVERLVAEAEGPP